MTRDLIRIQRSLLNVEDLARVLVVHYSFSSVHCRLLKASMGDSYDVWADNQRYLLRVYRHGARTVSEIEAEVNLLNYLHEMGAIVSSPVAKRNSEYLIKFDLPEGERYAVLFRYIDGKPLNRLITPEHARAYGGTLAQMHKTLDKLTMLFDRPQITEDLLLRDPMRALKSVGLLSHRARDLAYLHRITSVLRTRIAVLPKDKPGFGLIHGDVDSSNALINSMGRVGLIDFDFIGEGYRAYDLAAFIADVNYQGLPEGIAHTFLEGYSAVRPITDFELEMLPIFRAARAVWSMGLYATHVNEWGSLRFSDAFIDHQLDDIRTAMVEIQIGRE